MKQTLSMITVLILQGCSSLGVSFNHALSSGDYNPLTLSSVDVEKFRADKKMCFDQVQSGNSKDMTHNYSIMKFRECLIQKGYVLLS